jgi:HSP20 family molecular chaperone IbpA
MKKQTHNFFRNIVGGDKLLVKFRYHRAITKKHPKADLEVTIINVNNALRGTGVLAQGYGYKIVSSQNPELTSNALYVSGSGNGSNVATRFYSSVEDRNEALISLIKLVNQLNGKPEESDMPGTNPAGQLAEEEVDNQNNGGNPYMSIQMKSNTLNNVLGGSLVIDMPGHGDAKVIKSEDGKSLRVIVPNKDDATKAEFQAVYELAKDVKADTITKIVADGVLTVDVKYNLGTEIGAAVAAQ